MAQAERPVVDSRTYRAAIEHLSDPDNGVPADRDYYRFRVQKRERLVRFTHKNRLNADDCFGPEARLLDREGSVLGTTQPANRKTQVLNLNLSPGPYYLYFRGYQIEPCEPPGLKYTFSVRGQSRDPMVRITSARLSGERIDIKGKARPGIAHRRLTVKARGFQDGEPIRFGINARAAKSGPLRWKAGRFLREFSGVKELELKAIYRGDGKFKRMKSAEVTVER